ncbi:NADPH:quinone reductase [Lactobacillus sp. CBA3605]|uniref:NADP-dependent oxidoreductase n=1 Tax=Lactobacillus sp. CBA3605 TaxID=2099788 RepID=UPI000CFC3E5D|nr:NADP-dependent oxidoreductase [Lactobacillus sp. CBA3605]AVK61192.1 NADPH:quinone reductase [Lactobacillus sp. CBA3605]
MQAVVINQYGDADELTMTELPMPTMATDEVLVELKATSINPIDWKARLGLMQGMMHWDFPIVLGWDLSGVITAVGADVTGFKVGDEVFARPDTLQDGTRGTYAEFAAVKADKLALKPAAIDWQTAAAIPLAGLTAYQVVKDRLHVQAGDKVLIQAGAGGVGLFAIQIAKALGAYVATTASAAQRPLLEGLGADEVIDYHEHDITAVLHDYDAVFDTVSAVDDGLAILKPNGRLVTIDAQLTEQQQAASQAVSTWWLQTNGKQLAELGAMVAAGTVKVVIDRVLPFTEAGLRTAHQLSESHHSHGKIVISMEK